VDVVGHDGGGRVARVFRIDEENSVRADAGAPPAEPADRGDFGRAFLDARGEDEKVVSRPAHLRERERQRAEGRPPGISLGPRHHFAVPIGLSLPDLSTAVTPSALAGTPASK